MVQRDGRIATITIDRPADQNRLTRDVLLGLEAFVHDLAGDAETQAVVLTGAGSEFFSMGILDPVVRAGYSKEQILELVRTANRLYDALEALPQIVIAVLNGAARAGAAELSLACDIRLAAAHATFALPEALWGGFPAPAAPCGSRGSWDARGRWRSSARGASWTPRRCNASASSSRCIRPTGSSPRRARSPRASGPAAPWPRAGPSASSTRGSPRASGRRAPSPTRSAMRSNGAATWTRAWRRTARDGRRASPGAERCGQAAGRLAH